MLSDEDCCVVGLAIRSRECYFSKCHKLFFDGKSLLALGHKVDIGFDAHFDSVKNFEGNWRKGFSNSYFIPLKKY